MKIKNVFQDTHNPAGTEIDVEKDFFVVYDHSERRISDTNAIDSKELLAENAVLKSEIGEMKAHIKETKRKLSNLNKKDKI